MGPAKRARAAICAPAFCAAASLPLKRPQNQKRGALRAPRRARALAPRSAQCCAPLTGGSVSADAEDGAGPTENDEGLDSTSFSDVDTAELRENASDASTEISLAERLARGLAGAGEPGANVPIPASARVEALLEDISLRPEFYLSGVGAVSGVVLGSVVLSASLAAIDTVPLLPDTLRVVGIGYVFWFLAKYLFSRSRRAELAAEIQQLLEEVRQPAEIVGSSVEQEPRLTMKADVAEGDNGVADISESIDGERLSEPMQEPIQEKGETTVEL